MSIPAPVAAHKKLMTVDEFWDFVHLPENEDRDFELIRGEVVEMSRPRNPHGLVCANIVYCLRLYAEQCGRGYVICNDAGIILTDDPATVVGPDVAYFTDIDTFDMSSKWAEVPPVLAVEVSSPTDRPGKINAKIREYLTNGVKVVWQVDYEERNVTVHRPQTTLEIVTETGVLSGGDDLPGLSINVFEFFRVPGQKPSPS